MYQTGVSFYENPMCSTWHPVPAQFPFLVKKAVGDEGTITGIDEDIIELANEKAEPEGLGVKRLYNDIGELEGCEALRSTRGQLQSKPAVWRLRCLGIQQTRLSNGPRFTNRG